MISSEVQRTLVKSPPELWAEISDRESLSRHLGEFGDIRITRVEPEQRVEWQSGDTSGSVVIKPSGWGTKVMLTVTRELAEQPTEAMTEPEAVPQPMTALEGEDELEDEAEIESELAGEPDDFVESAPAPEPAPEQRSGFLARLFGRRRRKPAPTATALELATDEPIEDDAEDADGANTGAPRPYNALAVWASQIDSDADADEQLDEEAHEYAAQAFTPPQPASGEASEADGDGSPLDAWSVAKNEADADAPEDGDAAQDISAEIRAAEEVAAEEVTAVLTGVLDRLGAAHHRPFSRA
ncbi:MAG TPA: hypothetical protein VHT25_08245 [Solirubrobacteraceae bacterium]|jgi:hypothetical protein|nr:hypothetical protein [Solirubrobacteraceae bacterium]